MCRYRRPTKEKIITIQNKNCQNFRQYDEPISDDKCLHTLTSFVGALNVDRNEKNIYMIIIM